ICSAAERKKPDLFSLGTAIVTGLGIDFWLFALGRYLSGIDIFWLQLTVLLAGMALIGLGCATYLQAEFAASPLDACMLLLHRIFRIKISTAKNLLMLFFLLLAWFVNGPIGIGTVLTVFLGGPFVGFFFPYAENLKLKWTK